MRDRAKLIDPKRAQEFGAGKPPKGGTVYLTAADASGMMVSFIQSNYMGFGSGVVADGVSLQNRAATFVLEPATRTASARASVPTRPSFRASSQGR